MGMTRADGTGRYEHGWDETDLDETERDGLGWDWTGLDSAGFDWTDGDDEFRWPSPVSSTCNVELTLPNFSRRPVLAQKLLTAIEETKDRNFLK